MYLKWDVIGKVSKPAECLDQVEVDETLVFGALQGIRAHHLGEHA